MSVDALPLTPTDSPLPKKRAIASELPEVFTNIITKLIPHRKRPRNTSTTIEKLIRGHLFQGILNLSWSAMESLLTVILNLLLFVITLALNSTEPIQFLTQMKTALETQSPKDRIVAAQTTVVGIAKRHTERSLLDTSILSALSYLE
jgi:hypothetical protein